MDYCICRSSTECTCVDVCNCCFRACMCVSCIEIRRQQGEGCRQCGGNGQLSTFPCGRTPNWKLFLPDLEFLRTPLHLPSSSVSDEKTSIRRSVAQAAHNLQISRRIDPEISQSPTTEYSTDDDSLMFQMDDIDTPPRKASETTTTEAKNVFRDNLSFGSRTNLSDTRQLGTSEMSSSIPRACNPNLGESKFKWTESSKCQMPFRIPRCSLNKPEANSLSMSESQGSDEIFTSHDNPDYSNHSVNMPKLEESQRIARFSELKHDATDLKWTESEESEMLTTKEIPGPSYSYGHVLKPEKSQTIDGVSLATSQDIDEYASDSLPSDLISDDSPPSEFLLPPKSPTHPLSTSAPSLYDLPQATCKLEYPVPNAIDTPRTSSASNLPDLETLKVSDSLQENKSSTSGSNSSIEILPDNMPNRATYGTFSGQPGIPSNFVTNSSLNNGVIKTESIQTGTTQELSTSHSFELQSPVMTKSTRTSSESSSSIETISREAREEKSVDEAAINKSPREK